MRRSRSARYKPGDDAFGHPANPGQGQGNVELNFEAANLDQLEKEVSRAGVEVVKPVTDEGFRAPGGLLIKINELDPELCG